MAHDAADRPIMSNDNPAVLALAKKDGDFIVFGEVGWYARQVEAYLRDRLTSHAPVERCPTCESKDRAIRLTVIVRVPHYDMMDSKQQCSSEWHDAPVGDSEVGMDGDDPSNLRGSQQREGTADPSPPRHPSKPPESLAAEVERMIRARCEGDELHKECTEACFCEGSSVCVKHAVAVAVEMIERERKEFSRLHAIFGCERAEAAEKERDEFKAAEREVSKAYLDIRKEVDAFATKWGGSDRYEVTLRSVQALKRERDEARKALAERGHAYSCKCVYYRGGRIYVDPRCCAPAGEWRKNG